MSNFENIVVDGHNKNKNMDDICKDLITAGASYKEASKLYKNISIEKGYLLTLQQKREISFNHLNEVNFNPSTWDDVVAMINELSQLNKSFNQFNGNRYINKWALTNSIELPKRPKKKKYLIGNGENGKILTWMIGHKDASNQELKAIIAEVKNEPLDSSLVAKALKRYELYYVFHQLMNSEIVSDNG
jgi:hypothetical protein